MPAEGLPWNICACECIHFRLRLLVREILFPFIHSSNVVDIFWMIDIIVVDSPPYSLQPNFFSSEFVSWNTWWWRSPLFLCLRNWQPIVNHIATIKYNVSVDDTFCWASTLFYTEKFISCSYFYFNHSLMWSGAISESHSFVRFFFITFKDLNWLQSAAEKVAFVCLLEMASSLPFLWSSLLGDIAMGINRREIRVFS